MKKLPVVLPFLTLYLFSPINKAAAQEKRVQTGDLPEREEIQKNYWLPSNSLVKISIIAGLVEIETANTNTAEVYIVRSAQTRAELNCYKTVVQQTSGGLITRHEQNCPTIRDHQRIKLKVPRNVNLDIETVDCCRY